MKTPRLIILAGLLALLPATAAADSGRGSYTDSKGLSCTWTSFGTSLNAQCSGYVQVSYTETCQYIGTWSCTASTYQIGY
jgi:hypothetical protein